MYKKIYYLLFPLKLIIKYFRYEANAQHRRKASEMIHYACVRLGQKIKCQLACWTSSSQILLVLGKSQLFYLVGRQLAWAPAKRRPHSLYWYSNMAGRGFKVKIMNFLSFCPCSQKRLGYKEKNTRYRLCPKSFRAMLEYWYITLGLLSKSG